MDRETIVQEFVVQKLIRIAPSYRSSNMTASQVKYDMIIDAVSKEPTKGDWQTTIKVNEHKVDSRLTLQLSAMSYQRRLMIEYANDLSTNLMPNL